MNAKQFKQVTEWQDKVFPKSTANSKLLHLEEEIKEVRQAMHEQYNVAHEFADCFILLMGAAHKAGMSYEQVRDAIHSKMKVNMARKWNKPNEHGVYKHVKEDQSPVPFYPDGPEGDGKQNQNNRG